ncbi:hypothetical protein A5882_003688 [Enterococcus sp. 4E1_DIV0656]|uniref:hypothetical protein n=1 Tax=Enterococcus sp. 4E1_DIV0656 TaxID=1834180 RepID=UPI000A38E358|nr:hypothetical protein [Enterococcus sp. 4E1_DIV0656]OTO09009.1 hypothetical protein A5882_003688 [Enterococcus sp. 4E1_DIV0656]
MKTEGNLISFENKRKKGWTVIVLSHFSKELIGFLSVDAATENLCFTQKKEEVGVFTETEVIEILESIYALKDEGDVIHRTNEKNGTEDWISGKYFDFKKAKIEFK